MLNCVRPEIRSGKSQSGATLVELLVVLAIVSILAVTAIPLAENCNQRRKETELRDSLRVLRTAIANFHADWESGDVKKTDPAASENGFPVTLPILAVGASGRAAEGGMLRYLRRVPPNPFAGGTVENAEQWLHLGHKKDASDAVCRNGEDGYGLRANSRKPELDGSRIQDR